MKHNEKSIQEQIASRLVHHFGYEYDSAMKVADDVILAQKQIRLESLERYKGRCASLDLNGLEVDVIIEDVRIVDGVTQYRVTPKFGGGGHIWVQRFIEIF